MVPSKLNCKKRCHSFRHYSPYLVDCSTSAACSTASTHHPEPNPIASAASRISLRSPAAAKHAHLPAREPTHPAASLRAIPAATAISPTANPPPDRAADTPPPSTASGQRRQFPSRPLPFPKPAWSETAGCPNPETHTQIPAAHESPAAPPNRFPHTLESSSFDYQLL